MPTATNDACDIYDAFGLIRVFYSYFHSSSGIVLVEVYDSY